jgi:hypothetical protein
MNSQKSNYLPEVKKEALRQFMEEQFNQRVAECKAEIELAFKTRRWWHKIFPFKIHIERIK